MSSWNNPPPLSGPAASGTTAVPNEASSLLSIQNPRRRSASVSNPPYSSSFSFDPLTPNSSLRLSELYSHALGYVPLRFQGSSRRSSGGATAAGGGRVSSGGGGAGGGITDSGFSGEPGEDNRQSMLDNLPIQNPNLTPVWKRNRALAAAQAAAAARPEGSTPSHFLFQHEGEGESLSSPTSGGDTKRIADYFQPGSIKASIFNLCSATLGAGALALPYAFSRCGIILTLVLLILAAIASIYSIHLLIAIRDKTLLASYEDLTLHLFGSKMTIFVEINIIIFCFGTCIAYIVAVGDILQPISAAVFSQFNLSSHTFLMSKPFIMSVFVLLVMLPLSLVKSINSLRFSSLLGVLSILFLVTAIMVRTIQYLTALPHSHFGHHAPTSHLDSSTSSLPPGSDLPTTYSDWYSHIKLWDASLSSIFLSLPIIMFAFTCQVNVFSIYTELQRPSIRRMNKVVNRSFFINSLIYTLMGLFGYLHYANQTTPDILQNLTLSDPLIALAQFGVGLTVVLGYPLNVYPARFTLEMMFWSSKPASDVRFIVLTSSLVFGSLIFAIYTPNIDTVFGILGSTTSSIVCFILPSAYYMWGEEGEWTGGKKLPALALGLGGAVVGILCTAMSIQNWFQ